VVKDITNNACHEYQQMCDEELYRVDTKTFIAAFEDGKLNEDIFNERRKAKAKK
jgi:hypothetical protein